MPALTRTTLFMLLVLAGCGDGQTASMDGRGQSELAAFDWHRHEAVSEDSRGLAVTDLLVVENPANPLSFFLDWQTTEPSVCAVDVACDDEPPFALQGIVHAQAHEAFLMGFAPGQECDVTIRADGGESSGSTTVHLQVGPGPAGLPVLEVSHLAPALRQPGWTLFNLTNSFDKPPLSIVLVDEQGRVRWHHQRATDDPGSDTDVRTTQGGILVGGTHGQVWPAEVDWQGNVLWEKKIAMHHDLRPYADDLLLYLVDTNACNQPFKAGSVVAWNPQADEVAWQWNLCEHYTPSNLKADWSHLNTASVYDDGDLLVSSRNQNALFRVDMTSGDILWKLGEDGDFAWPDEARFFHQHDPEIQPDGTVLLFDNGLEGVREYSRALQLALDMESMTATIVWQYRPQPDIFAPIWGDADRLDNGNTQIVFGRRSSSVTSHIIEVTPAGEEAWHLVLPGKWGLYRAERISEPPRGIVRAGP